MLNQIKKEDIYPFMLKIAREQVARVMLAQAVKEMLEEGD